MTWMLLNFYSPHSIMNCAMVSFMHDHTEQVTLVPSIGTKDSTFSREDLVSFLISSYFHRYPWGNQSSIVPTQLNALTATKKYNLLHCSCSACHSYKKYNFRDHRHLQVSQFKSSLQSTKRLILRVKGCRRYLVAFQWLGKVCRMRVAIL